MSRHHIEREEKICLNCNAATYGRYCHVCGQENIETTESFWHLLKHFVFDLFHFDGKFWVSVKYLLIKPGFLAKEYIRGRRASYLHPIRMYIFISTVFFIIFFSFYSKEVDNVKLIEKSPMTATQKILQLEKYKAGVLRKLEDSVFLLRKKEFQTYLPLIDADIEMLKKDSTRVLFPLASDVVDTSGFYINSEKTMSYSSFDQYDSFQTSLPKNKRNGYIKSYITKKGIEYKIAAKEKRTDELKAKWIDTFLHSIPKILFISMPFFALILMILYVRNKKIFYVHHIIFTLYFYCGIFILNLFNFWGSSIKEGLFKSKTGALFEVVFGLIFLLFMYKSFKNFYEQSRIKTILKLISIFFFIILLFTLLAVLAALLIQANI